MLGQNVELEIKGNILTATVDLSKRIGPSKTGKTTIVATTGGNVVVDPNTQAKLGLNVFVPVAEKASKGKGKAKTQAPA